MKHGDASYCPNCEAPGTLDLIIVPGQSVTFSDAIWLQRDPGVWACWSCFKDMYEEV